MNSENYWKVSVDKYSGILICNQGHPYTIFLDVENAKQMISDLQDAIKESERIKESLRPVFFCPLCKRTMNRADSLISNVKFFCDFCSRYWFIEECKK